MISYDTLPFKTFHLILDDLDKNIHLLGIEDKKEALKVWDHILEEWQERHPSSDERELLAIYKSTLSKNFKFGKLVACLQFMLLFTDVDEQKQKELFESIGLQWKEDPLERLGYMNKQLDKAKTEKEIHDSRLERITKEIDERREANKNNPVELSISDINKSIASLEMAGFTIDNYDTLTCGKYDAMSAVIRDQNQKLQKHG